MRARPACNNDGPTHIPSMHYPEGSWAPALLSEHPGGRIEGWFAFDLPLYAFQAELPRRHKP